MPTDTFFRLNDDKRNNITRCAMDAFAGTGYTGTSMDSVADAAGVAKGALYRYFTNKKDMYMHVVDALREDIEEYVNEFIDLRRGKDVFVIMRDWLVSSYVTQERLDVARKVLCNALYQESVDFKGEVLARFGKLSTHYVKLLLQQGIADGSIRRDIDLDAASFMFQCVEDRFEDAVTMPYLDMGYSLYKQPQAVIEYKAEKIVELFRMAFGNGTGADKGIVNDGRNNRSKSA